MIIRFLFSGPARAGLLHADPHPGNFRLLADGRLGVLDFGAVDRLPDGFPPIFGRVLRLMHDGGDLAKLEDAFRSHGYLRDGVSVDLEALRAFLAPLAEPSRAESFRFSREWLHTETMRASALRSSSVLRRLNLPPSYVLIHRVLASGLGVLCQLECASRTPTRYPGSRPTRPDEESALVGFLNSATGVNLGFYAARSYSLMRPPRTGRRLIRSWERSATGWSGWGGCSWRLRWGRRPL